MEMEITARISRIILFYNSLSMDAERFSRKEIITTSKWRTLQ